MPVVLRAAGVEFDVDQFCAGSRLTPEGVYRRGAAVRPLTQPQGRRHGRSIRFDNSRRSNSLRPTQPRVANTAIPSASGTRGRTRCGPFAHTVFPLPGWRD